MDKKELRMLSKNELIKLLLSEREARLKLEKKLEEFEHLLKAYDNPHIPSSKIRSKKNTERDESQLRFPGKPEGSNGGGIHLPPPDKEEVVQKECCPNCGNKLGEPYDTYRYRQMDIPTPKFVTTEYIVGLYHCSCGAEIDAGEHFSKGFYGPNTTALLGSLRCECLSYDSVARLMKETYKLPISSVSVYNKMLQIAILMSSERELIKQELCKSDHLNMDETGMRRDGLNGQVWNISTAQNCLFEFDHSRGANVAQRMLAGFNGTLTTDDFKSYAWYYQRQLCWAHLLREAKEFAEKYGSAKVQYARLKVLYDKAKHAQEIQDTNQYDNLAWELEDIATCYRAIDGCRIMYGKLHNRAEMWLLGVKLPYVSLTNNRAERNLRKVVLQRNRMGCIRNESGKLFINNFMTCTSTWRIQEKNTYEQLSKYAKLT